MERNLSNKSCWVKYTNKNIKLKKHIPVEKKIDKKNGNKKYWAEDV